MSKIVAKFLTYFCWCLSKFADQELYTKNQASLKLLKAPNVSDFSCPLSPVPLLSLLAKFLLIFFP